MKKIYMISAAVLSAAAALSCTGNVDPEGNGNGSGTDTADGIYTVSVDKTELEADATSVVTFTLKDENGIDLTLSDPSGVYFRIEYENGEYEYLDRLQKTYSAFDNGTYVFRGVYKGTPSENTVTVTAVNRSKYEKFHRNVAIYKMTGTWCPSCPSMTAGLNGMEDAIKEHTVILACHGNGSGSDPFRIVVDSGADVDLGNLMLSTFGLQGFPSLVINLNTPFTERTSSAIEKAVNEQRRNYPATCGIKVESVCEDGKLSAKATLMSDKGGTYDIECALLLDDQYVADGVEPDGIYNHIVRSYSGDFCSYASGNAVQVAAGEEHEKTFTLSSKELSEQPENCSIVIYALKRLEDGTTMVDNIVSCPVNGNVGYVYNE